MARQELRPPYVRYGARALRFVRCGARALRFVRCGARALRDRRGGVPELEPFVEGLAFAEGILLPGAVLVQDV